MSLRPLTIIILLIATNVILNNAVWLGVSKNFVLLVQHPFISSQVVFASIWLAFGTQHVIKRIALSLLLMVCIFFFSIHATYSPDNIPWTQLDWVLFFLKSAGQMIFDLPATIAITTLPMLLLRRFAITTNNRGRLSVCDLLVSTSCFCISLALLSKVSPYLNWIFEIPWAASEMLSDMTDVVVFLPSFNNSVLAYFAAFYLFSFRIKFLVMAVLSIVTSVALATFDILVGALVFEEIGSSFSLNHLMKSSLSIALTLLTVLVLVTAIRPSLVIQDAKPGEINALQ